MTIRAICGVGNTPFWTWSSLLKKLFGDFGIMTKNYFRKNPY